MGSVVGIQNQYTHLVFRFFKYKFYIFNSYRIQGKLEFKERYFGLFGFYPFKNLQKFSDSIIVDGKPLNYKLEGWIDYRIVRRKETCVCNIDFKKYPKGSCPCGKPNELIEIRNEGSFRSNKG